MVYAKCIGVDDRGRVKMSRRAAMEERGEQHLDDEAREKAKNAPPREDRGGRGRGRGRDDRRGGGGRGRGRDRDRGERRERRDRDDRPRDSDGGGDGGGDRSDD